MITDLLTLACNLAGQIKPEQRNSDILDSKLSVLSLFPAMMRKMALTNQSWQGYGPVVNSIKNIKRNIIVNKFY